METQTKSSEGTTKNILESQRNATASESIIPSQAKHGIGEHNKEYQ